MCYDPRMIPRLSHMLVFLQFVLLGALVLGTPPAWPSPVSAALIVAGIALGVWAVRTMRLSRLRILPEPGEGAELVTAGPYRWIRHPMYTASLLAAAGLVVASPTPVRLAMAMTVTVVLVIKLMREERLLLARFPDYGAYQRRTRRLLPFVW